MIGTNPITRKAFFLLLSAAHTMAAPGNLDANFSPQLEQQITPISVVPAPDGKFLLGTSWEGFQRVDGQSTGDRMLLMPDGTPAGEPVPGLLEPGNGFPLSPLIPSSSTKDWFPLGADRWLIPVSTGGWLLADGTAPPQPIFTDLSLGESIQPQFIADGKLWVIRSSPSRVEVRRLSDGAPDPAFQQGVGWPALPLHCVPAADGGAWIMAGDPLLFALGGPQTPKNNQVFRIHADGSLDTSIPPRDFNHYRAPRLSALPGGGYHVCMGHDYTWFTMWPQPTTSANDLSWHDATGTPLRSLRVISPAYSIFWWADAGEDRVVATGPDGRIFRYLPDGTADTTFTSPGWVSSLISLPDGKWLIDGTRRLLPDGQPDPSWHIPLLSAPAQIASIVRLPDGRMLVSGRLSSVGGVSTPGIALMHPDGSVDTSFQADPRVGQPLSLAVSGNSIYVVPQRPVILPDGSTTTLVKLGMDGVMDESFHPQPAVRYPNYRISRVYSQPDGTILAEGFGNFEVASTNRFWIDSAGAVLGQFSQFSAQFHLTPVVPQEGGLVVGATFYSPQGAEIRQVGTGSAIQPVCQWQGGVLFTEDIGGIPSKLRFRLWKNGRWVPSFASAPIPTGLGSIHAVEGPGNTLYLTASWQDGSPSLKRMLADGSIDPTFTGPSFTHLHRRDPGAWRTAGATSVQNYDPAVTLRNIIPSDWAHDPVSNSLWIGGDFNQVSDVNRDGLARLHVSPIPLPPGTTRTAYDSWALGLDLKSASAQDDLDNDGIPNALEFLFGTDPRTASEGASATMDETDFIFSYPLSREAVDADHTVECSNDLIYWTTAEEEGGVISERAGTGDIIIIRTTMPRVGRDRLFFRLRAIIP